MPFIRVESVAEVALLYLNGSQNIRSVLHFELVTEGSPSVEQLTDLADAVNAQWDVIMQPTVNGSTLYLGCTARSLDDEFGPAVERLVASPLVGSAAGDPEPNNVALAIKKLTGLSGRSFRGRVFHPCLSTGQVLTSTRVTDAFAADIVDRYGDFLAGIVASAADWIHVVVSKYSGMENVVIDGRYKRRPIPRTEGVTTPVTGFSTDGFLDSQRRRLAGRGT